MLSLFIDLPSAFHYPMDVRDKCIIGPLSLKLLNEPSIGRDCYFKAMKRYEKQGYGSINERDTRRLFIVWERERERKMSRWAIPYLLACTSEKSKRAVIFILPLQTSGTYDNGIGDICHWHCVWASGDLTGGCNVSMKPVAFGLTYVLFLARWRMLMRNNACILLQRPWTVQNDTSDDDARHICLLVRFIIYNWIR